LHHSHLAFKTTSVGNSEAHIQSTLKRTKTLAQSDLSDFVFEPENLF